MKWSYFNLLFLFAIAALGFSALIKQEDKDIGAKQISANEDLMREHGALNRLLLIYQEISRRIEKKQDFPMEALTKSARIIRNFIEDYHEKLEEEYIFPYFEQANELTDLVKILKDQHQAGRQLTDYILSHANEETLKDKHQRSLLSHYLQLYIRMFRPHEAREGTILFPALHQLLSNEEYEKLGEIFEEREHDIFGEKGFEKIVGQITEIEKQLGIYDLSQFTSKLKT